MSLYAGFYSLCQLYTAVCHENLKGMDPILNYGPLIITLIFETNYDNIF